MSSVVRQAITSTDTGWDPVAAPVPGRHETELLRRVALGDSGAFADLYGSLSTAVLTQILRTLPVQADATAVHQATFVEVWWLADFHLDASTDVPAWIAGIANRRASERLRGAWATSAPVKTGDRPAASRYRWWSAAVAADDRRTELEFHALFTRPAWFVTAAVT